MNRRGLLRGILAAGIAPAVVGSGILMPLGKVWVPPPIVIHEGFKNAMLEDALEQIERAVRDVVVYGTGGLYMGVNGVRRLGPRELYKTADEITLKMKWAGQCRSEWGR